MCFFGFVFLIWDHAIFICLFTFLTFDVIYNFIYLNMNESVVGTGFLTTVCWIVGSFRASELHSISLSIFQSHSRISWSPLWIFHQQTLTHKQMLLWHKKTVSTVAICSLAVQATPALVPLSSEVCARSDRKHSETLSFIQKISDYCLSSWRRWWATPLWQRRGKKYPNTVQSL